MSEGASGARDAANFAVVLDPALGGRWSSLRDRRGCEWLWRRDDPGRAAVQPGAAFVDAGGVEECFPELRGTPDHGDVWSRPWTVRGERLVVTSGACVLSRRVRVDRRIVVDYELTGPPGMPFVWAFHALLEPDVGLRVGMSNGPCLCWPGDSPEPITTSWPAVLGDHGFAVLGPDDGSSAFAIRTDCAQVQITRGDSRLRMELICPDQPVSVGIWRNLGGYPEPGGPPTNYRSCGVEPMLGRRPGVSGAEDIDLAHIPASGELGWRLVIDDGDGGDART